MGEVVRAPLCFQCKRRPVVAYCYGGRVDSTTQTATYTKLMVCPRCGGSLANGAAVYRMERTGFRVYRKPSGVRLAPGILRQVEAAAQAYKREIHLRYEEGTGWTLV